MLRLLAGARAQPDTSPNHQKDSEPVAEALGVSLCAKQVVSGYDRARLVRLCATVPPPWLNMVRYFGVLSSHSCHRAQVVPSRTDSSRFAPEPAVGDQLELALGCDGDGGVIGAPKAGRSRWGWLLRHVFRADLETWPC